MSQAYQPLHHKYRPQRFDQLVGQEAIATTLSQALRQNRIAPAYLLSGPRGTGKTSSARILARSLNCLSSDGPTPEPCGQCDLCIAIAAGHALDVIEIDAASNTGVDNIRDLIERSRFAPVQARWKVYVIDECHMLSTAAFNALLKTLEEPPPRVVFVLATTDPQRVLPTILSRCQRFDFRRIPLEALEGHLRYIAGQEEIGITPEALHVVAQRAQGGLRDAESLLDQLSLLPAPIEALAVWELLGAVPEQELLDLAAALAAAEPLPLLESCRQLLDRGREPSAVLQGLASLLRDLVLAAVAPDRLELTGFSPQFRGHLPALADQIGKDRLLLWQSQLRGSEQHLRQSVQPRLWLDVLLLGLLAPAATSQAPATPMPVIPAAGAARSPSAALKPAQIPAQPPIQPAAHQAGKGGEAVPSASSARAPAAAPPATTAAAAASSAGPSLAELWQQILSGLELPSTRMLLSQQAMLVRLDSQRAVVRVSSNWMPMVQSRLSLLETAVGKALGSPRQLVLEGGDPTTLQQSAPVTPPAGPAPTSEAPARPERPTPGPRSEESRSRGNPGAGDGPEAAATAILTTSPPTPARAAATPTPSQPATTAPPSQASAPAQPAATEREPTGPTAATAAPAARPAPESRQQQQLDEKARRLADFFNGEVINLEEPIEDNGAAA